MIEKLTDLFRFIFDKLPEWIECGMKFIDTYINPSFTDETAKKAVSELKTKDGSKGEHWTYEEALKMMKDKGYHHDPKDWYVAMNTMYAEQYKSGRSDDTYAEIASNFLGNENATKYRMKKHWLNSRRSNRGGGRYDGTSGGSGGRYDGR